jgi:predicted O-methyltransferase YrrM
VRKGMNFNEAVLNYAVEAGVREHPVLAQCRADTAALGRSAMMQIAPEQGAFMGLVAKLMGAKRAIEVGTFTGYSALSVALVLPDDGQIVACDVSEEWTAMARRYWHAAGIAHKIDLYLAPATETLAALVGNEANHGTFDFAFIDADKANYATYYDHAFKLIRRGGVIAIDNVLWGGSLVDESNQDEDSNALRALNQQLHKDDRIDLSMVPIGDGLTLARKR